MAVLQRPKALAAASALILCLFLFYIFHESSTARILTHVLPPSHQTDSSQLPKVNSILGPVRSSFQSSPPSDSQLPNSNHTRILIIPRTSSDDTSWLQTHLPSHPLAIYTVDAPTDPSFTTPKNKGHEVMAYLTYIITHYHSLPSILIFMHAHRHTWHNNELLGNDAVQTISRLNADRVVREGYMNLRCAWDPGCPEWLHPFEEGESLGKQEQGLLAKCWHELFPLDDMPRVLAQPCCGQFAVSRERVLQVPRERWVFYRDWLLRTPLTDYFSGRLWEFVWQFVFTGEEVRCPDEEACYCDGFGVCFGEGGYVEYVDMGRRKRELKGELEAFERTKLDGGTEEGTTGREVQLKSEIEALEKEMEMRLEAALKKGEESEEEI